MTSQEFDRRFDDGEDKATQLVLCNMHGRAPIAPLHRQTHNPSPRHRSEAGERRFSRMGHPASRSSIKSNWSKQAVPGQALDFGTNSARGE